MKPEQFFACCPPSLHSNPSFSNRYSSDRSFEHGRNRWPPTPGQFFQPAWPNWLKSDGHRQLDRTIAADQRRLATLKATGELIGNWDEVPDHMAGRIIQRGAASAATFYGTSIAATRSMLLLGRSAPVYTDGGGTLGSWMSGRTGPAASGLASNPLVQIGNLFNRVRGVKYPYNEVYVENPAGGYWKLDSYNPGAGEIVSRKMTQLSEISESSAVAYIREAGTKYPPGARIANVPTNVESGLAGQQLQGRVYLEVPIQTKPVPQRVLNAATKHRIVIRDVNGKVY